MALRAKPIQAGVLSFLLPGLGQVYQHRYVYAAPFFLVFIFLLWSDYRLWIFVPMAAAAWDAQRIPAQTIVWNTRVAAYFLVGGLAFFAAFSLLAERVIQTPQMGKMNYVADSLADAIHKCGVDRRAMPSQIGECGDLGSRWRNDPWGQPYAYELGDGGFEIRSLGRDGVASPDDFIFKYHFPAPLRAGAAEKKR